MFDHMSKPSAFGQALGESAGTASTAVMGGQPWQDRQQTRRKVGDRVGRGLLEAAQVQLDADHGNRAVEVRPSVYGSLQDLHQAARRVEEAWHRARMTSAAAALREGARPARLTWPSSSKASHRQDPPSGRILKRAACELILIPFLQSCGEREASNAVPSARRPRDAFFLLSYHRLVSSRRSPDRRLVMASDCARPRS